MKQGITHREGASGRIRPAAVLLELAASQQDAEYAALLDAVRSKHARHAVADVQAVAA